MALIRSKQAAALVREAVVLDLGDLARQGEAIKARAVAQADQILKKAQDEAKQATQSAAKRGHDEGLQRGLAEGRKQGLEAGRKQALEERKAELERLQAEWTESLESFVEARKGLLIEARIDVLRLALAIAERVVFRTIELDPTVIEDQMAEAISLLAKRSAVIIRINPGDMVHAQEVLPALVEKMQQCEHATLVADDSLTPGGCILQAGTTTIDATIETQMDRIVAALLPHDAGLHAEPAPDLPSPEQEPPESSP